VAEDTYGEGNELGMAFHNGQCTSESLQILEGTINAACKEMDALHRLINGIALLDVLQSFATTVG